MKIGDIIIRGLLIKAITSLLVVHSYAQMKGATPISIVNGQQSMAINTYAVVVGISDYQDPGIPDLRFADKDAEAFANFLRSPAGGSLDQDHVKVLINAHATMAQFGIALDWLIENAKENDRVIIYFSGHGDVEKKTLTQPGFLLCWDAPSHVYISGGAIALPIFQEVISTLSIQNKAKVIVITDACRSGKLSGTSVSGSQLTNANLSRQFSNEIKILSCQPNEYSIEGVQWGGGRGAFSYHLLNALYGLSDTNYDSTISLGEVRRYLEDHVSRETAPLAQEPMVMGIANELLFHVDDSLLKKLKTDGVERLNNFASIESKGLEQQVLSMVDTSIKEIYFQFYQSISAKRFLEPTSDCAEFYYLKLMSVPSLSRLSSSLTRNYAAALQDDAQQILNLSAKAELRDLVVARAIKAEKYLSKKKNLGRAAELLGKNHYMYASLQARKYFFEGWAIALQHRNSDSISGLQGLERFKNCLKWQSDFPQCYYQIAWVYAMNFHTADSCEYYAKRAAELLPSWVVPYAGLAYLLSEKFKYYDKALHYFYLALKIDSTSAYIWNNFGNYYLKQNQYTLADEKYLVAMKLDSAYVEPYYNLACSMSLQHQKDKAYEYLESALRIGYDYAWINNDADLIEVRNETERWKTLMLKYFPDKVNSK